jgi:hypothetical protein
MGPGVPGSIRRPCHMGPGKKVGKRMMMDGQAREVLGLQRGPVETPGKGVEKGSLVSTEGINVPLQFEQSASLVL